MKRLLAMFTPNHGVGEHHFCNAPLATGKISTQSRRARHCPSARYWLWKGPQVLRLAAAALLAGAGRTAAATAAAQPNPTTETRLHCPAKFITAIAIGPRGGLWVSDEDTGIYHRKAGATDWDSFNTSNSPGLVSNHIYSLCV
ncbi:MAG: hypothetical protein ACP5O7_09810, partial [Phycisphaerae bacterium]